MGRTTSVYRQNQTSETGRCTEGRFMLDGCTAKEEIVIKCVTEKRLQTPEEA
jgi:hypothetical protein